MLARNVIFGAAIVLLVQVLPSFGRGAGVTADRHGVPATATVATQDELLRVLAERYLDAGADGTVAIEMPLVRVDVDGISPIGVDDPRYGREVAILDSSTGVLTVRKDDRPMDR